MFIWAATRFFPQEKHDHIHQHAYDASERAMYGPGILNPMWEIVDIRRHYAVLYVINCLEDAIDEMVAKGNQGDLAGQNPPPGL